VWNHKYFSFCWYRATERNSSEICSTWVSDCFGLWKRFEKFWLH